MREPEAGGQECSEFYYGEQGVAPELQFTAKQPDQCLVKNQDNRSEADAEGKKRAVFDACTQRLEAG